MNYTEAETWEIPPYTLSTLPPKNYYIKFVYSSNSTKDHDLQKPFIQKNRTILFNENSKIKDYKLYDIDGRLIMYGKANEGLDLSEIYSGIYLLKLTNDNNIYTSKISIFKI